MSLETASRPARGGVENALWGLVLSERFVLYLTLAYVLALAPFLPTLLAPGNISNILSNTWPLYAVALGQTLVLIVAGIDLSQGAVIGLTSVIGGLCVATVGSSAVLGGAPVWGLLIGEAGGVFAGQAWLGVALMIAAGALVGALNGLAVARFDMPPFIVTLSTFIAVGALAVYLTQSENVAALPDSFVALGKAEFFTLQLGAGRRNALPLITAPMLIVTTLAIALSFMLNRTLLGRRIYAVGASRRVAEISGVPVRQILFIVFVLSGVCAAIASVLYSARLESGRPTLGDGAFLLDVIGAAVIGGTSLFGGRGRVVWTFFGVLFFVILSNTLNLMNLATHHIFVVKGAVILAVALVDAARTRKRLEGGAA